MRASTSAPVIPELKTRTIVTAVVPMYDEAALLAANLARLDSALAAASDRYDFTYVLVDDGSSDDTYAIAQRFARGRDDVKVLRHERNLGLGAALKTAREYVRGDYVLTVDADLSYAPASFPDLLDRAAAENADVVLASAYMAGG